MLQISQEPEANHFNEIIPGDESSFRYSYPCSKIFAPSPAEMILRTGQAIGAKQMMITVFFTKRKRIVLDVMPKGRKFTQLYFTNCFFRI
jgi:hypothetical protein